MVRFAIFSLDAVHLEQVRALSERFGWETTLEGQSFETFLTRIEKSEADQEILFVDFSSLWSDLEVNVDRLEDLSRPGTILIASGDSSRIDHARMLRARGATDYLPKTADPTQIDDALENAAAVLRQRSREEGRPSYVKRTLPRHNQRPREPFLAFISDNRTLDALRPEVVKKGWQPENCILGGLRNAIQSLSVKASPEILLVDISESGDPKSDINALAEVCEPGTLVITIGEVHDVLLYREMIVSGIFDYLLKPLELSVLRGVLEEAEAAIAAPIQEQIDAKDAHVALAVIGARGGTGASTLATSLAWLFATEQDRSTALLDLDVHFGSTALKLDLEPGRGLTDAIENPGRIDKLFVKRAMVQAHPDLAMLSAEAPIAQPLMTDGSSFTALLDEFNLVFDTSVIDLPRAMMINFPQLLDRIGVVTLVVELTLASARDSIRILSWLRQNAPSARVLVACNKVTAGESEISKSDFEQAIERCIDIEIPFDPKASIAAAKSGRPVAAAEEDTPIVASVRQLSRMVHVDAHAQAEVPTSSTESSSDENAVNAQGSRDFRPWVKRVVDFLRG